MNTFALDFETYYDKDCSIQTLGPIGYFSHPDFDAYMVSVVGDEGTSFVGHPKDFDWGILKGQCVLSHNASFDETLYIFGVEKGWWDYVEVGEWHCTADMAAFCGLPRSLKGASSAILDTEVDKETRDNMKGKKWENMPEDFREEVSEYALKDSELCLSLWQKVSGKWPEQERKISFYNRQALQKGLPIDQQLLKDQKEGITKALFDTENSIPWFGEAPTLSRKAFNEECRKVGLEPPVSLSMTDDDANKFISEHGKKYKWIQAVRDFRRINSLKKKLESFDNATMPDGRYYGGLMYMGAHTGRWSGSGGNLNLQNLPRGDMFGTNLRNLISAKKGKALIVADLSQIEVRTLCWLAKDDVMLEDIANSPDIYEAFAYRLGFWEAKKGEDFRTADGGKLRHWTKQIVLGCGYGASAKKFAMISDASLEEAHKAVRRYRTNLRTIPTLWNDLQRSLHRSYALKKDFILELPSGRALNYGKISTTLKNGRRSYVAKITKGSKKIPVRMWGGLLAENFSQALARDVFADQLIKLVEEGLDVLFHVHDEFIIEVNKEDAEQTLQKVIQIMSTAPNWIPDIPLAADGKIVSRYEK